MATNGHAAPQTTRQVGPLAMPVLNIQGKAYAPVNVRVEAAHAAGGYTMIRCEWKLIFEIKCCEVEIAIGENHFIGTAEVKPGFAYSIEDMQTSALGRALGFAGFEIKTAIASADDMAAVLASQGRATVVESEPEQLPPANLKEEIGKLGRQLFTDRTDFETFLYSYTNQDTGKVALQAAYNALKAKAREKLNEHAAEQEAEEDAHLIPDEHLETALVHLHDELRRFPAD